jgi:hypothetical protein
MQRTLGATVRKVVSKRSLFGRSLVEVSRPVALAQAVDHQKFWIGPPGFEGGRCARPAAARKLRAQSLRDRAWP